MGFNPGYRSLHVDPRSRRSEDLGDDIDNPTIDAIVLKVGSRPYRACLDIDCRGGNILKVRFDGE